MVAEIAAIIDRQVATQDGAKKFSRPQLQSLPTGPIEIFTRPLEPIAETAPPPPPPEPAPWTATAKEWEIWVSKRDAYANFKDAQRRAREYALENDLRGTF